MDERRAVPPAGAVVFRGGPLGNFAVSPFTLLDPHTGDPRRYRTVEHHFQACKACDAATHRSVAEQPTPRAAKQAGRMIDLRPDWEDTKFEVMLTGLRAKFAIIRFAQVLLGTGNALLLEDSTHDFEWGARDADGGWGGQNLLGLALMQVRAEIAARPRIDEQLELL